MEEQKLNLYTVIGQQQVQIELLRAEVLAYKKKLEEVTIKDNQVQDIVR